MSTLVSTYFGLDKLKTLVQTLEKKGEKGVGITVAISDEMNQYGQNVKVFVSQSKEQRDANAKKFYVANGEVIWSDSAPLVVTKQMKDDAKKGASSSKPQQDTSNDSLPF